MIHCPLNQRHSTSNPRLGPCWTNSISRRWWNEGITDFFLLLWTGNVPESKDRTGEKLTQLIQGGTNAGALANQTAEWLRSKYSEYKGCSCPRKKKNKCWNNRDESCIALLQLIVSIDCSITHIQTTIVCEHLQITMNNHSRQHQ